jgi:CxxC motif-containing protein (DUF1111 family)
MPKSMLQRFAFAAAGLALALTTSAAFASEDARNSSGEGEAVVAKPGGDTTVEATGSDAFALSARNLDRKGRRAFAVGNSLFNNNWVEAPASAAGRDGLGPLFNARSCSACHFRDGRSAPPEGPEDIDSVGLLHRLRGRDSVYGDQLQTRALPGVQPEARVEVMWLESLGHYADGEPYRLRRPEYRVRDLAYGPLSEHGALSARVAPALHGLGLLEAIPEEDILALADPNDADGDGISGVAARVQVPGFGGDMTLGRFGWKAEQATVESQVAGAFIGDMGITSRLYPVEKTTSAQRKLIDKPDGGSPEIDNRKLDRVAFYCRTLAVPDRRNATAPLVRRGEKLFAQMRCDACHTPSWHTGEFEGIPAISHQDITPYTDMLLHDMGEELADPAPASGEELSLRREWRTPPLWGLGLVKTVNGHDRLLHDGRARGFAEAILWHGGEAEESREAFRSLSAEDRAAVIAFLESL